MKKFRDFEEDELKHRRLKKESRQKIKTKLKDIIETEDWDELDYGKRNRSNRR